MERREHEPEAEGAARLAGVEPPAEILDAPCGFGRHSIPLANAGFRVTGVDRSPSQLAEAQRRAGDVEWPRWVQADFRDLPFADASFDAVFCLFTSIGYRGEDGDRRMFVEFLRVLRPRAALLVETMHRDRLMAIFQPRTWEPLGSDATLVEEHRFDYVAGEIETQHTLLATGERRTVTWTARCYTATELVRLIASVGFVDVECFGDFDGGSLSRDTRLVIRARK